jgi:hypothetical protein
MSEWHPDDVVRDDKWLITRRYHNGGGGEPKVIFDVHHIHAFTGHVRRANENLHQTIPCSSDWEGHGRVIYRCRTCTEDAPDAINGFMSLLRWER